MCPQKNPGRCDAQNSLLNPAENQVILDEAKAEEQDRLKREALTQRANDIRKGVIAGVYNELVSHIETGLVLDQGGGEHAGSKVGGEGGDGAVRGKAFAGAFLAAQEEARERGAVADKGGGVMEELRKRQAGGVKGLADALELSRISSALPKQG